MKSEKPDWEEQPIGALLGDIDDFSNYVMLSGVSQNNEIITAQAKPFYLKKSSAERD